MQEFLLDLCLSGNGVNNRFNKRGLEWVELQDKAELQEFLFDFGE
jgi:hypothetical protein